jgi:hypothetical protein
MHKCGMRLAWVKECDGKIVKVFDVDVEPGRKSQVIKRMLKKALEEGDIKDDKLIYFLRRSNAIPTTRMIRLALTPNKYIKIEDGSNEQD